MSYARFGWDGSDVYVFVSSDAIECCGCLLQEREWVDDPGYKFFGGYFKKVGEEVPCRFQTTAEMVAHLEDHKAAGQCVPDDVIPALLADADENEHFLQRGE